ncbi:MAG: hypothetical protein N4A35_00005, partial [Flavobacteriales bacterium]|nr:hypothetical protein [Flavobacteriales bacterium]
MEDNAYSKSINRQPKSLLTVANTRYTMIKTVSFVVLLCSIFTSAIAGTEHAAVYKAGNDLSIGETYAVEDGKLAYMLGNGNWSNTFFNKQSTDIVSVGFDREATTTLSAYAIDLHFSIQKFDDQGVISGAPETVILSLDYDPVAGVNEIAKSSYKFNGFLKYEVTLTAVKDQATQTSVALPANVYLNLTIDTERYYRFDYTAIPSNYNQVYNTANNNLVITWDFIEGAESYDVEWTYVNDYGNIQANLALGSSLIPFTLESFKHNSSRIRTTNQFYEIPLLLDRGYLVYRIRGVGKSSLDNYEQLLPGKWSTAGLTAVQTLGAYQLGLGSKGWYQVQGHESSNKNWQVTTSFAEGGKRKDVVSYFDGSLRNRQSVTQINTNKNVIVGETLYDYEGRAAINVLPTPSDEAAIKYVENFNINANTGTLYDKFHFDIQNATCNTTTPPMSDQSGASKYYGQKTGVGTYQDYVPDAEGYPFTVTTFTPDNTGRIAQQTGVGATYKKGSGKETQYFYGQPDQEDLDALFGNNVGYKSRYKKNMVVDANGQVSVTYTDAQGRTIATALAGTGSNLLEEVKSVNMAQDSRPENGSLNGFTTVTKDLLSKVNTTDTDTPFDDNNRFISGTTLPTEEDGLRYSGSRLFESNHEIALAYTATNSSNFSDSCLTVAGKTYNYVYDLIFGLMDPCQNELIPQATTTTDVITSSVQTFPNVDFGNESTLLNGSPLNLTGNYTSQAGDIEIGSAQLYKKLQVNSTALDYFANRYYEDIQGQCTSVLTYEDFYNSVSALIDTTDCDISCESCVNALISQFGEKNNITADVDGDGDIDAQDQIAWQEQYDICMEPCVSKSLCDVAEEMMLSDVSPNGQYFIVDVNASDYTTSVFNGLSGATLNNLFGYSTVQEVVDNWQSDWATSLLQYHPEYCYITQWCNQLNTPHSGNELTSNQYSQLLGYISDYSSAATVDLSHTDYVFLLGSDASSNTIDISSLPKLIENDPFFKLSVGASYSTDFLNTLNNYQNSGKSLFDFVAWSEQCGRWYGSDACSWNSFLNMGPAEQDELFPKILAIYNTERTNYMQEIMQSIAIDETCYNGAFNNTNFNKFLYGFYGLNAITNFPTGFFNSSEYYNASQPSSIFQLSFYKDKQRRFPVASEIYPVSTAVNDYVAEAQAGIYLETGICPLATDLELFLNELAEENKLTQASVPLVNMHSFTSAVYEQVTGLTPAIDPYSAGTYSFSSGTTGTGTLSFANGTSVSFSLVPTGTITSVTWTAVKHFSQLIFSSENNGTYHFDVLGKVEINGTDTDVVFSGETTLPIGNCEADVLGTLGTGGALDDCTPSAEAQELWSWISTLNAANLLNNSSYTLPSNMTVNTTLGNLLGGTITYTQNDASLSVSSPSFSGSNGTVYLINNSFLTGTNYLYTTVTPTYTSEELVFTVDNNGTVSELDFDLIFVVNGTEEDFNTGSCVSKFDIKANGMECGFYTTQIQDFFNEVQQHIINQQVGNTFNLTPSLQDVFHGATTYTITDNTDQNNCGHAKVNNYDITFNGVEYLFADGGSASAPTCRLENFCFFSENDQASIQNFQITNQLAIEAGLNATPIVYVNPIVTYDITFAATTVSASGTLECANAYGCAPTPPCIPTPTAPVTCANEWHTYNDVYVDGTVLKINSTTTDIPAIATQEEFCEAGMQYVSAAYMDYLTQQNITSTSDIFYVTMREFGMYNAKHYYQNYMGYIANNNITATTDVKYLNLLAYAGYGIGNYSDACIAAYLEHLADTTITEDKKLTIAEVCVGYAANPTCFTPDPLVIETEALENPCVEYLNNLIEYQAREAFEDYVSSIQDDFKRRYIAGAIDNLVETFEITEKDAEYHYTLYEYDQSGSLVRTIPPQGANKITETDKLSNVRQSRYNQSMGLTNPQGVQNEYPGHTFATTYTYNTLNQLKKQRTPDGGISEFWYDALSRIILSQNAVQKLNHQYSYSFYDALGRIVEAGQVAFPGGSTIATLVTNQTAFEQEINGNGDKSEVTKTYYDESIITNPLSTEHNELRNRIAHVTYAQLPHAGNYDFATHYLYDIHGNVKSMVQDYKELAYIGQQYKRIDYEYDLISGNVNKVSYQEGEKDEFYHQYEYDADNRIIYAKTSNNGVDWEEDANYQYYDHGPLARVETGDVNVQGTDYAYTIQGWLKGVNSNTLKRHRDIGKDGLSTGLNSKVAEDVFGFSLGYFHGDYKKVTENAYLSETNFLAEIDNNTTLTTNNLYNGNITHMATAIKPLMTQNDVPQTMVYSYDLLNRIAGSKHLATQINANNEYLQAVT